LCHFNVGERHVGIFKIGTIARGIEEGSPEQIGILKVGVTDNGLLEGDSLEILAFKGRAVEINTSCDGYWSGAGGGNGGLAPGMYAATSIGNSS
jgi:hypothetical protein